MAIKVNLSASGGADKIEKIMLGRTEQLMKSASIEFFRQVIIVTPVDTGRARYGWYITVGEPSKIVPNEGKYKVPDINSHSKFTQFTVKDKLFITNNVPYITELNNGSSKQAPARFVENAAARVQNAVAKLVKKIK
jgi:hypothetical protein